MLRMNLRLERDYEPGLHDMLAALPPRLRAEVVRKLLAQAWLMGRLRPAPATATSAAAPMQNS
jgi:hypothetical protein